MQFDGHPHLLWSLGSGRFVNYTLLNNYLHLWKNDGLPMYAMHKSILEMCSSSGITSTLTYNDIHRSICGFFATLEFDDKVAFSCPKHGNSPVWINTDGKCTVPAKRRVKHVEELDRHPVDVQVLPQSTKFKDRVFLSVFAERSAVCALVTEKITTQEFLEGEINSENGLLVRDLVVYLDLIPKQYQRLLSCISKGTSVRGLLQPSNPSALRHLQSYCEERINLRDAEYISELKTVMSELPAVWSILDNICCLENKSFLPEFVRTTLSGMVGSILLCVIRT